MTKNVSNDTDQILLDCTHGNGTGHCAEHPKLCSVIHRVDQNMDKITTGLYGTLDNPGTGFIAEIREDRTYTREKMNGFERDISSMKNAVGGVKVSTYASMAAAAATILSAVAVAMINGVFK